MQFEEGVSNELSRRLLQLEIRSQDSPSIADVLVVERVRWVKTFAQHATLGVLEVAYKKVVRGPITIHNLDHCVVSYPYERTSQLQAVSRFYSLLKRASGTILRAQRGKRLNQTG